MHGIRNNRVRNEQGKITKKKVGTSREFKKFEAAGNLKRPSLKLWSSTVFVKYVFDFEVEL